MRPILRRLPWLAGLLMLGVAGWSAYYVCNHGLSRHWRVRVSNEFRRRGVDLYVHRLTLDPVHGLVAREVQIFEAADPSKVLATIDRVALDINLTNLMHGRPFLDAVDLRNADLSLPLNGDDPQSDRVKVSRLNARVIFPPHEWYVSEAEATMYGMQVSARGRLQNPEAFQPNANAQARTNEKGRPQMALDVLKELETFQYGGAPPRIEITFGGDLADLGTVYADATVHGALIRRAGAELKEVSAALSLRHDVIELKQCNVNDAHGELDASGSYDLDSAKAALQLRSTVDPEGLAHLLKLNNPIADWRFAAPPVVELTGSGVLGEKPKGMVLGHVALGRFAVKDAVFTGAGADFSWDGSRWYMRNGWLGNHSGQANARAMSVPGKFQAQLQSNINPNTLRALLSGGAADGLRDWDFQDSPKFALTVTGTSMDPGEWETQGQAELGRTRMRGVPLNWASSGVDVRGLVFTYRNFTVQRTEGAATGTFSYDFGKHEAWMTNVHSHLITTDAAVWVDPDLPRQLAPYRFKGAPDVTLDGFVQCATDIGTHLDVHVNAPSGMDYTFCGKTLSFPSVSGEIYFGDHRILLKDIEAMLYGGTVRGWADIEQGATPGYTAQVGVKQIDFASITKLYFNYDTSQGLLNGKFDFGGKNDDPWTLYGNGAVEVTDGDVFAIPVLGPFSGILNTIVPGMGYNLAHDGTCAFTVRDGVITTRDFVVKGRGFSMIGTGRLFFLDDRLNFNIRLNAQGLPGVLLFPVSKLLEYAGTGTLEDPVWRPVLLETTGRRPGGGGPTLGAGPGAGGASRQ